MLYKKLHKINYFDNIYIYIYIHNKTNNTLPFITVNIEIIKIKNV